MTFKAVIFDFDGVLFDSEKLHLKACNQIFKTIGFTITAEKYFQSYVGLPDNEMFDLIFKEKNMPLSQELVRSLKKNKVDAYKKYINSFSSLDGVPGVKAFIQRLALRIKNLAICSSATYEEIETTLRKLENGELKPYFKEVISIDDIIRGKPAPEGYLLAATRLGVPPESCLAIEDTPVGILAAKNAGMTVIGITTSHDKNRLNNADYVADSYDEIDTWMRNEAIGVKP